MLKIKSALMAFSCLMLGPQLLHAATLDLSPTPNIDQRACMDIVTAISTETDPRNGLNKTLSRVDEAIRFTNEQLALGLIFMAANKDNLRSEVMSIEALASHFSPHLMEAAAVLCLIDESDGRHNWHVSRNNVTKNYEPSMSSAREILNRIKAGEIEPYQVYEEVKNLTIDLCDNTSILDRGNACDYFSETATLKFESNSDLVIYKEINGVDMFVGQFSPKGFIVINSAQTLRNGFQVQVLAPSNGTGIGSFIARSKDFIGYKSYTATVDRSSVSENKSFAMVVPWESFIDSFGTALPHPSELPRLVIKVSERTYAK